MPPSRPWPVHTDKQILFWQGRRSGAASDYGNGTAR